MFGEFKPAAFPSAEVVHWRDVREQVAGLNPGLASIIDEIDPDDECRLYRCRYPYGSEIVKRGLFFLPNSLGQLVAINDPSWSQQVRADLDYNSRSNPASILLNKSMEYSFQEGDRTFLYATVTPGKVFGTMQLLDEASLSHHPMFIWDLTAGAHSIFLLTKVADNGGNDNLRRLLRINAPRPDKLVEHWEVFRELGNSAILNPEPWVCEVLFFSKRWFERFDDPAWHEFHRYLLRDAWHKTAYRRNQIFWEGVYGFLQAKRAKVSPYIAEIVRHLLAIAVGAQPAFAPAVDEDMAPVAALQRAYSEYYRLRLYYPVVMVPSYFQWQSEAPLPVYYSFQFSAMMSLMAKNVATASASVELFDAQSLLMFYLERLQDPSLNLTKSPIAQASQAARFDFFHASLKANRHLMSLDQILAEDPRFETNLVPKRPKAVFPANASFLRGCVRIAKK